MNADVLSTVELMIENGDSLKKIRGFLDYSEVPPKEVKAFIEINDLKTTRPKGVLDGYYEFLGEERRTKEEAEFYIDTETTDCFIKNKAKHLKTWAMTVEIWNAKD